MRLPLVTTIITVAIAASAADVTTARGDEERDAPSSNEDGDGAADGVEGDVEGGAGAAPEAAPDMVLDDVLPGAVLGAGTVDTPEPALDHAPFQRCHDASCFQEQTPGPALDYMPHDAWRDSISCGAANRGALYGGVMLPQAGIGYVTPEPWWSRGRRYGTVELVGLIMRAAAAVEQQHPGGLLGVADLSSASGGVIAGHRSHQSGRDVDLVFYALDPSGTPFPPDQHMAYYGHSGVGQYARAPSFERDIAERYFDLARNWALVRALLTDSQSEVEHIFVSARVRRWLLDYAQHLGEPEELVMRAARVLRKPKGVDGHNDHMHVRVRCSPDDEAVGRCRNENARRPSRARRWRSIITCPSPLVSSLAGPTGM